MGILREAAATEAARVGEGLRLVVPWGRPADSESRRPARGRVPGCWAGQASLTPTVDAELDAALAAQRSAARGGPGGRAGFFGWPLGKRPAPVPRSARPAGDEIESGEALFRLPLLRETGARTKFLSPEPLLGPLPGVDLARDGPGPRRRGIRPRRPTDGAGLGAAGPGRMPAERGSVLLRAVERGLQEAHRSAPRRAHPGRDAATGRRGGCGRRRWLTDFSEADRLPAAQERTAVGFFKACAPRHRLPGRRGEHRWRSPGRRAPNGTERSRRAGPANPGARAGKRAAMLLSSRVPAILGSRPMAGHTALDRGIGVRVPASQPAGRGGAATSRASSEVPRPNPAAGEGETS